MAAFVQGNKNTGGATTSGTITLTGTTAGNFLAICASGQAGGVSSPQISSVTGDSNTWNRPASLLVLSLSNQQFGQIVYAFNAVGGNVSLTVNFNSQSIFWALLIGEWSGIQAGADPLDLKATNSGSSTSPVTGSISPTSPELVIATFGEGEFSTTWSAPGGWNVREETQNDGNEDASMIDKLTASGSTSATWTGLSNTSDWVSVIASFKLALAPSGLFEYQAVKTAAYY